MSLPQIEWQRRGIVHFHMLLRVKSLTIRPRPLNPSLSRALPWQLTIIVPKYGRILFLEMSLSILIYYILFRLRNPRILDPPTLLPFPLTNGQKLSLLFKRCPHLPLCPPRSLLLNGGILSLLFKGSLKS